MSDFPQQIEVDAQLRSQMKFSEIRQQVAAAGLLEQLGNLPRFDAYHFIVREGAVMIDFGRISIFLGVGVGDILLKKGVFAWNRALYQGLFSKPMDARSAALLQLAFIEWEAHERRSVEVFPGNPSTTVNVKALCSALDLMRKELSTREEHPIASLSLGSGPMEIDDDNGIDGNKKPIRTILDKIREIIPAVDELPELSDTEFDFRPHEKTEAGYLPLRLYTGTLKQDPGSNVWMYMTITANELHQNCEAIDATSYKCSHNTAHWEGSVRIRESEMPINDDFHRYFESGIRTYRSNNKNQPPNPSIFTYTRKTHSKPHPTPHPPQRRRWPSNQENGRAITRATLQQTLTPADLLTLQSTLKPRRIAWYNAQQDADVLFEQYKEARANAGRVGEAYNEAVDVQQEIREAISRGGG
ncbi:hypothetical protein P171DRAFT_490110 [Karstenula rhodostoma CBS 690.94]|uniref:Uncharacterized protein n=1 Tax=Karstenula rhodostoma CBS 690.94 TaxID=1392251 RepID=A0A9P4PAA1_9PLEO|nr:hypothetical protein P171DRAFT_490110 [Karstenula rhodostoma CBS 690.94]